MRDKPIAGGSVLRSTLLVCMGAAAVAAVFATGALGDSGSDAVAVAAKPMLAVAVVGSGRVTSKPAGISCPGRCSATFAAGSSVLLTPKAKSGSAFLRWGGNCTGARACTVKVSAFAAVAAQFVRSTTPPPPTNSVESGTYSGPGSTGYNVSFFVPPGAGSVLNFSVPQGQFGARVYCAGGGAYDTPFKILKATIKSDRTFTAKTSQSGVVGGANATITYVVTGRFQGKSPTGATAATGIYRENIVFTDTPSRTCTSNDISWTAARSLPPSKTSVEPGTYSGPGSTGYNVSFLVPGGAGSVLNFSVPQGQFGARVYCAGGGAYDTPFKILQATINPDRSFTAKSSQSGVVGGANATMTYLVTGYFQGLDAKGATTAAGVYRENIVFTNTPSRTCTSNDISWTAARTG